MRSMAGSAERTASSSCSMYRAENFAAVASRHTLSASDHFTRRSFMEP